MYCALKCCVRPPHWSNCPCYCCVYDHSHYNTKWGTKLNAWLKKMILLLLLSGCAQLSWAISPYVKADTVAPGEVAAVMSQVEKKLQAGGFNVVGKYQPVGIADSGVIVATDKEMLDAISRIGGDVIVGAGIRVGVKKDGTVSYMNPQYWYRAYLRKNYSANEGAVKSLQSRLAAALGAGAEFGGETDADSLAHYHYMFGMEYFEDDRDLATHASFDQAVAAVRANLARGVGNTSKVYEVVLPERKIAVFGVAMNDRESGDGAWVNRIAGSANIAALPYEIFVVGDKTEGFYARYRIALSWPSLTMGSFTKIISTPGHIKSTLQAVAQ